MSAITTSALDTPYRRSLERTCDDLAILALAVVALVASLTFRDYGLGWDDYTHAEYADLLLRMYGSGFKDTGALSFANLYMYGGGFPAAEQSGGSGPFSPAAPPAFTPAAPPPWQNEAVLRDHPIPEPMHPEPSAPKPKRNLLFSSTSRKERDRAQARSSEPLPPDLLSSDLRPRPPSAQSAETAEPPASFDDTWPKAERAKAGEISPPWRSGRMPPTLAEANGGPARPEDQPEVTVLKSGIVDGMAYSLYSDGSIEAQMPEGMMRFASIDELRAHLDQRP